MTLLSVRGVLSRARWLFVAFTVVGVAWAVRHWAGVENAAARTPAKPVATQQAANRKGNSAGERSTDQKQAIVALVNGQTILRDELAKECMRHHGEEVLESLVNRRLVEKHCRDHGVAVTQQEIDEEIDRIARKFSLPKDEYLKLLQKDRGIKPHQYGKDIVWPTLALRKLASAQLTVTQEELEQAYESQFGPAVKARLIVLNDQSEAQKVLKLAKAKPAEFGALARKHSKDVNSASSNGLIQPIRHHLGDREIEQVAFELKEGEISSVISVGNQFAILKSEGMLEPASPPDRKRFDAILTQAIKDRKLRAAASETFKTLQDKAQFQNVMNDRSLSETMPGVAAMVNGVRITLAELGDQCVERHGTDVLDGVINRRLLEQSLKRRKLAVTDTDLETEVARAAMAMGKVLPNKQPDIEGWLATVTKAQGISEETYIHDVVWPSAAMKKIVGDSVKVTEEDLDKGFQANYGKRVRCRAIVFNSLRKAQDVWEMARQEPTIKKFKELAEEYSIEANSRSLGGEIPPIQQWSGQPVLEHEAFKLQAGEISGVVQVGENFVVLFCEGYTKPVTVDRASVQEQLYADILEKKQRLAMADTFEKIKADATIDNYLAATSHSPKREKELLDQEFQENGGKTAKRPSSTARSAPKR